VSANFVSVKTIQGKGAQRKLVKQDAEVLHEGDIAKVEKTKVQVNEG